MLYKVNPFGYFGRIPKLSRGPWFEEHKVEDDGLEYFYVWNHENCNFLLSNNIPLEDRERMAYTYKAFYRNKCLAWCAGIWLGFETVMRVPQIKKMAFGWKMLSLFAISLTYKNVIAF